MQAKKAKQLLKARLARERQIYEMRKRAELKAAIADLERPWELVQRAAPQSALFSVGADEQLKTLADRFQRPGGFDLWSEDDGPQLFETPDGLPTARFFPKGVVHSIKPYGRAVNGGRQLEESQEEGDGSEKGSGGFDDGSLDGVGLRNRRVRRNGIGRNSGGRSQSGTLVGDKFVSDTEESDGEDLFGSSVNLESRVGNGVWNAPNVRSLTRGKQRDGFRHSGNVDGSLSGLVRNKTGGRNGMNLRSQTRGGKLGNGSIGRELEKSGDENADFSHSQPSYGSRNERCHRGVNNRRGTRTRIDGNGPKLKNNSRATGTGIDGNGPKVKDLGGRQMSSNMRNSGRQWSSGGGNRGRFRQSRSEDAYDMSLQGDGSYGSSLRNEDAKLSPESTSTR